MPQAEQRTDPVAEHGEGPVWFDEPGQLRWVDMLAGDVLTLHEDSAVTRRHVGTVAAALRPRSRGGFVVGLERCFALDDGDGSPLQCFPNLWDHTRVRMNEGGCDPDGRFYCGSMAYDKAAGAGALYRLDPDGTVHVVLERCSIANGLDWSPDGGTAYFVDTATQRIDAFDYSAARGLVNRRPLVSIPVAAGAPDGLTVDSEGAIWVALWGGSAVHRYLPSGSLDLVITLPVSQVTACTIGGRSFDQLFITTSRLGLPEGVEPQAGSVFEFEGVPTGRAVMPFAG